MENQHLGNLPKTKKMKNRISQYIALCMLSCFCSVPSLVYGQDDLDTIEFVVTNNYNPTISDAYKISDFPTIDVEPLFKPTLNYNIKSDKFTSDFEVVPVKPARIKGEPLQKLYRAYIKLAGGSPGIFAADAYYNSLRSKRESWGVHVNHFSSAGNVAGAGYSGFSDTQVNLYGKKFLRKHTLSGGLDYDMNKMHFYGFDTTDAVIAAMHDTITGRKATLQKFNTIGWYGRLLSHHKDSSALNYDVRLAYYNLQDNYQAMENNFTLTSDLTTHLPTSEFIHIYFKMDYNDDRFYKDADSMRILTNTVLTLRPEITTRGAKYKFTVGVNGSLDVIGDLYADFYISPRVYFSYNLIEDIMIPYVGVAGGLNRNTIRSLSEENPFIMTDIHDDNSNTSVNNTVNSIKVYGGIQGEFSSTSSFNISVTRDKLDNQFFYVNDTANGLGNKFGILYDNVALLNLHGEMSYSFRDKIKLMLLGDIYQYKMDIQDKPWHRPGYEIALLASYNLEEKIIARADIFAIGEAYAREYDASGSPVAVKLRSVADLNLELEYRYTKKLSVYLKLNNLTAQRYYRWNQYPTMRFSFLGGLTYIF